MTRTDIINSFIHRRGYKTYLEIGVGEVGWNFAQVDCQWKCAVDPAPHLPLIDHQTTSDEFFRNNGLRFDLVFIDGLHQEDQVRRDIGNALAHLNPGGAVVLHDCLPPNEWHQRPYDDYAPGENWNGDVWKAVLRHFAASPWECYIVDCDWGCGVIDTRSPRHAPSGEVPEDLEYKAHFSLLRPFVQSEAQFLSHIYGVQVFYHVAGLGNWHEVVREHFRVLADVGLPTLTISHVGCADDLLILSRAIAEFGLQAEVASHCDDVKAFEAPAMRLIEAWARDAVGSVLYFHTKGVSAPNSDHKRKWRELMTRETIGRWKENVRDLDDHDVVGVNWRECAPIPHFSGNFWWARADWIRSLAPFDAYYQTPCYYPNDWGEGLRLACEFWIGSAPRRPRVKSLVCSNVDFCTPSAFDGLV